MANVSLGRYVLIFFQTIHGIWNMDFFRFVVPRFCVSSNQSVLSAISSGYISALWPFFLIIMISLTMELHKYNFKVVVYPWKLINWVSSGAVRRRFAETNLIHTFVSFFLHSYMKAIFVSFSLLGVTTSSSLNSLDGTILHTWRNSFDPQISYFSHQHLVYVVPAMMLILLLGVFILLVLLLNRDMGR